MHSEWEQRPGSILIRAFVSRIKAGVDIVEILLIHSFFGKAKSLAKALKMHDLTGPQELDDIIYVRII